MSYEQAKRAADLLRKARTDFGPAVTGNGRVAQSTQIHSSAYREEVAEESILRWRTAREIAAETPSETQWIAKPWMALGGLTELGGKVKAAGKTTFAMAMCRQVLDGAPFLGEPTLKSPVIYLTEQPDASLRESLERAGLLDRDDFHLLSYHDKRRAGLDWPSTVAAAKGKCIEVGANLLAVDTGSQFAELAGDMENNAGAALEAFWPLQLVASEGIGVLTTRHDRKSGGDVGDSGRGSSAFAGTVDIVLSLRRCDGNARATMRVIYALSRFDATPDTLVIELTDEGYVPLGSQSAVAEQEAEEKIRDFLPSPEEAAKTFDEIQAATEVGKTVLRETLKRMTEAGQLHKSGTGKKGDPFRWCMADLTTESASKSDEIHSSATSTYIRKNESETEPTTEGGDGDALIHEGAAALIQREFEAGVVR